MNNGPIRIAPDGEVKAAFLVEKTPGIKVNGVVLVEQEDQWVTWRCYRDEGQVVWDCETGNYFLKHTDPDLARKQAEYDFGRRIGSYLTDTMHTGIN